MIKKAIVILFAFVFLSQFAFSQGIRKPVWAGKFYDADAESLSEQIDQFLKRAKQPSSSLEDISALIIPHAGHQYSGMVAASVYKTVQGKNYETVVIIGPSHHYGFHGCSIYPKGGYQSPLGIVNIDSQMAEELSLASGFNYIPKAHLKEHCIEVQIPFIQKILPHANIVPIIMGAPSEKIINTLAFALTKALKGKKVLIIASTDMSHFYPKKQANKQDLETISLIENIKIKPLLNKVLNRENIMCGGGPVLSTLIHLQQKGEFKVHTLHYADSSQFGGTKDKVVGYFAAAITKNKSIPSNLLSKKEKKELINLASHAIDEYVKNKTVLDYDTQNTHLAKKRGAFVTLKKNGLLRGCIGFIEPISPLYETVLQAAIYAACKDARFPPVSASELDELEIEISVLSPVKKIKNPETIRVGKHGLIISQGDKRGLLLPQVPVENNWTRETFLEQTCLKAGLPPDAWKKDANIFIFEADVFH
ncbi:MAG: AmmeMemoRadiSam system protein B [Candidatus Aminicenantaceae bacterium]